MNLALETYQNEGKHLAQPNQLLKNEGFFRKHSVREGGGGEGGREGARKEGRLEGMEGGKMGERKEGGREGGREREGGVSSLDFLLRCLSAVTLTT